MSVWQIIQLSIVSWLAVYVLGLILDFIFEMRMCELNRKKQNALKEVASLRRSRAVVCAKTFKIERDYANLIALIERKRKFIRNLILFNRKKAAL